MEVEQQKFIVRSYSIHCSIEYLVRSILKSLLEAVLTMKKYSFEKFAVLYL